jgi:hypothetical protein
VEVKTGQYPAPLSHPGMLAAGDLHRDPGDARTATGSPSVAYEDWQPGPQHSSSPDPDPIPVNRQSQPPQVPVGAPAGGNGYHGWTGAGDAGGDRTRSPWTETDE